MKNEHPNSLSPNSFQFDDQLFLNELPPLDQILPQLNYSPPQLDGQFMKSPFKPQ